jgi:hypothetical protein
MKPKRLAFVAAGAIAMVASYYIHKAQFSNEAIFQRQRPAIEIRLKEPEVANQHYKKLRSGLAAVEGAPLSARCRFDREFAGVLEHGSKEDAMEAALKENYTAYHECDAGPQIKEAATQWHGWLGIAGLISAVAGAISFLSSLRRRIRIPDY